MRLFSARRAGENKKRKSGRKILIVAGVMLALFMAGPVVGGNTGNNMFGMTSYAASYTWQQEGEIWRLKDASGNNIANTWYQDTTGARYYLDASGVMKTGLVDVSGYSYYLDASGKMMVTDGVYEGVNLIFDKDVNSATYGAILSGAQELKAAKQAQPQTQVAQPQTQEQKKGNHYNNDQTGLSRIAPLDENFSGSYEPIDESNIIWN